MRTFTLQSLMSKRMVHIVWNKQEQLSSVCFPFFFIMFDISETCCNF